MEIWKDIIGFEGRYQVSNQGRVKSLARMVRTVSKRGMEFFIPLRERILKPGLCRGYFIVNLPPEGTIAVHLLVARAFLPNPNNLPQANHLDGVKANCRADNLEWETVKGNLDHAVDLGLNKQAIRVVDPVTGDVYPSIARAARTARISEYLVSTNWARA